MKILGNIIIDFKPEFGNVRHVKIVKLIGDIEASYKKYKEALAASKSVKTSKTKIDSMLRELQTHLEREKKR